MANLKRLKYLRDVVIPHLNNMPTIEDVADEYMVNVCGDEVEIDYETALNCTAQARRAKEGVAVLNFNTYLENNTPPGFAPLPVSKDYDCSREGCLMGWYVFMASEKANTSEEQAALDRLKQGYFLRSIAHYFGIQSGVAQMLFGPVLRGSEALPDDFPTEDTLWGSSQMNMTKLALESRTEYLDKIIKAFEFEEAELAAPA